MLCNAEWSVLKVQACWQASSRYHYRNFFGDHLGNVCRTVHNGNGPHEALHFHTSFGTIVI